MLNFSEKAVQVKYRLHDDARFDVVTFSTIHDDLDLFVTDSCGNLIVERLNTDLSYSPAAADARPGQLLVAVTEQATLSEKMTTGVVTLGEFHVIYKPISYAYILQFGGVPPYVDLETKGAANQRIFMVMYGGVGVNKSF